MRRINWLALAVALVCSSAARADNQYQTPYQQFNAELGCPAGGCLITFPAVATETLILNVSCRSSFESRGSIAYASLGSSGAEPYVTLPVFAYPGGSYQGINATTYFFVGKGQEPMVTVGASAAGLSLGCTLSGNRS